MSMREPYRLSRIAHHAQAAGFALWWSTITR
jgi:hypothetical protein